MGGLESLIAAQLAADRAQYAESIKGKSPEEQRRLLVERDRTLDQVDAAAKANIPKIKRILLQGGPAFSEPTPPPASADLAANAELRSVIETLKGYTVDRTQKPSKDILGDLEAQMKHLSPQRPVASGKTQ
jgi:hypothetical protein